MYLVIAEKTKLSKSNRRSDWSRNEADIYKGTDCMVLVLRTSGRICFIGCLR